MPQDCYVNCSVHQVMTLTTQEFALVLKVEVVDESVI
jgi:hypothetical protein